MLSAIAYLLDRASIRNLCLAYFVLAPFFLNQGERMSAVMVFMAGHLVTGAVLGLVACRRLVTFEGLFVRDRITLLVIGFLSIALVSVLVNAPGNILRPDKIVLWYVKLAFPALTFLVMVTVLKPGDVPLLIGLLFGVFAFSVLVVALQAATGFPSIFEGRYTSFFFDPNGYVFLLNAVLAFVLPTTLGRMLDGRPFLLPASAVFLILWLVLLTGSRGGLLISVLLLAFSVLATRAWRVIIPVSLAAVPVLAVFAWTLHSARVAGGSAMSDMGRLLTSLVAINIIKENPFFGVGYGGVVDVFIEYGREFYLILGRVVDTHNAFLAVMAETGIVGLVILLIMLFGPMIAFGKRVFRGSWVVFPAVPLAGFNLMAAFVVYGLFYPHFLSHDDFWAYYALIVLMLRSWKPGSETGEASPLENHFPFSRVVQRRRSPDGAASF